MAKIVENTRLDEETTSSRFDLGRLTIDQPLSKRYKQYQELLDENDSTTHDT